MNAINGISDKGFKQSFIMHIQKSTFLNKNMKYRDNAIDATTIEQKDYEKNKK